MKNWVVWAMIAFMALLVCSCDDDEKSIDEMTQQTIVVYMPWSGSQTSQGLYQSFLKNLADIDSAIIADKGLQKSRLVVFISESASQARLYEVTYSHGECVKKDIKTYENLQLTKPEGIADVLGEVKRTAPALNYAMIIGCHGAGWTFADSWRSYPYRTPRQDHSPKQPLPWDYDNLQTRFFGGDVGFRTDIHTLADGIRQVGMKMQYILFDDCYMANIETAYELREVTNFLIASTSEVMAEGMPYKTMFANLKATPNYAQAVTAFNNYYAAYQVPCGSLSAIDCRETEAMAEIMQMVNRDYHLEDSQRDTLQILDGFKPAIFYDMGHYVEAICTDKTLLGKFQLELAKLVKSAQTTEQIYSFLYSAPVYIDVNHFSGITISDPSENEVVTSSVNQTNWWKATH